MNASPEVLRSIEGAPNIHDRLIRYTITRDGGELMMGQLTLQHHSYVISQQSNTPLAFVAWADAPRAVLARHYEVLSC